MRARNIKPSFFLNEELAECEPLARILFIGLWCMADREGKLEDRPKRIKASIFPYEKCDVDKLLTKLQLGGLIMRYEIDGTGYVKVPNFTRHQKPHVREAESAIPDPDTTKALPRHDLGNGEASPRRPECGMMNDESPLLNEERGKGAAHPSPKKSKRAIRVEKYLQEQYELEYPGKKLNGALYDYIPPNLLKIAEDHGMAREKIVEKWGKFVRYYTSEDARRPARKDWPATFRNWME